MGSGVGTQVSKLAQQAPSPTKPSPLSGSYYSETGSLSHQSWSSSTQLDWLASKFQESPCLHFPSVRGLQHIHTCLLRRVLGSKLRSSPLYSKNLLSEPCPHPPQLLIFLSSTVLHCGLGGDLRAESGPCLKGQTPFLAC